MVARQALLLCALLAAVHSCHGTAPAATRPQPPGPTSTVPPPFQCAEEYGLFPDPYDCHSFYECNEYIAFNFECPDNLAWNDAAHMCDYDQKCK